MAAVTALPALCLAATLPADLVLPAIAAFAFTAAAVLTLLGRPANGMQRPATVTIRDLAGACVLVGVAAGAGADPAHVSQLFGVASAIP